MKQCIDSIGYKCSKCGRESREDDLLVGAHGIGLLCPSCCHVMGRPKHVVGKPKEEAKPTNPKPIGHPGYLAILDEMRELHLKKGADYGYGADPLANLRASSEFGIEPWHATIVRLNDKIHRIKSFCVKGKLENESFDDALMDAACYAVLALALLREKRDAAKTDANEVARDTRAHAVAGKPAPLDPVDICSE